MIRELQTWSYHIYQAKQKVCNLPDFRIQYLTKKSFEHYSDLKFLFSIFNFMKNGQRSFFEERRLSLKSGKENILNNKNTLIALASKKNQG